MPELFTTAEGSAFPVPGSRVEISGCEWHVRSVEPLPGRNTRLLKAVGLTGIVRDKEAIFVEALEKGIRLLPPTEVDFLTDASPNFEDTVLHVEASLRRSAPVGAEPQVRGRAAIDDMEYQIEPTRRALASSRIRLLVADDVGLGKTLEAGLLAAELILRRRASRILVVTTKSMLEQFQGEFWNRFSIPLVRLDSAAISRVRDQLPDDHNPFDHFDKAIVSVDTLKGEWASAGYIDSTSWDLIIIDEAHNVAERRNAGGRSQRARLAERLARASDALVLLTATPHDGSFESFGSLIRMLDPTALPDITDYERKDVEQYLVRRFRDDPAVAAAIEANTKKRVVKEVRFSASSVEEEAYGILADLTFEGDEERRRRGEQLFRTTLEKAMFSSPMALIETIEGRLRRSANDSDADRARLSSLKDAASQITRAHFSKYHELLAEIRRQGWKGRDPADRLVIFSERIATLRFLEEALAADLGLHPDAIRTIHGSGTDEDELRRIIRDFGLERSSLRILLASDLASEGLNLHHRCHKLFHFDNPWSLMTYQQRNGRIDRYRQRRQPMIWYFLCESVNERIRGDQRILEVLIEKDQAVQKGIGDPAAFMGAVDVPDQEAVTAAAIEDRRGAEAFRTALEANLSDQGPKPVRALDRILGRKAKRAETPAAPVGTGLPHLIPDTFTFVARCLSRLRACGESLDFRNDDENRIIELAIPEDFRKAGDFGIGAGSRIDTRFMPEEAVPRKGKLRLTPNRELIDQAIERALAESDTGWPDMQYLWEVHPIVDWVAERVTARLGRRAVPVCGIGGRLPTGTVAYLMHGAISNLRGATVVDHWACVEVGADRQVRQEPVGAFLARVGLADGLPNPGGGDPSLPLRSVASAVRRFQDDLVRLRKETQDRLDDENLRTMDALERLQKAHHAQIEKRFEGGIRTVQERRRDREKSRIDKAFDAWLQWVRESCELPRDHSPYVSIVAVFHG